MTADTRRFLNAAGEFLRADPATNTVILTVTEDLRVKAAASAGALRGHGFASAATAAVSQAALEAGLREVVLYTDLANATSNAVYQRLGYRPVEDRVVLSFTPARRRLGFTRERTRGLRPAGRR